MCAPPLVEQLRMVSATCNGITVSAKITKKGVVVVALVPADSPPPRAESFHKGMTQDGIGKESQLESSLSAWGSASVTNPSITTFVVLEGSTITADTEYDLYAYAEHPQGKKAGESSGMSSAEVAVTVRKRIRTAKESEEDLDLPWEELQEDGKLAEALAALRDPLVVKAALEANIDLPRPEDLRRVEIDPVAKITWRSFKRWWAGAGGAGGREFGQARRDFLLRECIFAAQQPEILEEAARMNVQLLEGDWLVAEDVAAGHKDFADTSQALATHRWKAFRSWYRGGRTFDQTPEATIAAALLRPPPSPLSLGQPLTPKLASVAPPDEVLPSQTLNTRIGVEVQILGVDEELGVTGTTRLQLEVGMEERGKGEGESKEKEDGEESSLGVMIREVGEGGTGVSQEEEIRASVQLQLPEPVVHSLVLVAADVGGTIPRPKIDADQASEKMNSQGTAPACMAGGEENGGTRSDDIVNVIGIEKKNKFENLASSCGEDLKVCSRWEGAIEVTVGTREGLVKGSDGVDVAALPDEHGDKLTTAKRLRVETRSRFLEAQTKKAEVALSKVGQLLNAKREDVKAKRSARGAPGVVSQKQPIQASTGSKKGSGRQRRRRLSEVEREMAVKKIDELLELSGKAEEVLQRRGSLSSLQPEDVITIGVFDRFDPAAFDPEKPDPILFRHHSSDISDVSDDISPSGNSYVAWAPRVEEESVLELQLACVHPGVLHLATIEGVGVPDPEDSSSMLSHRKRRWKAFAQWFNPVSSTGVIPPHRRLFLDSECEAALKDLGIREVMQANDMDPAQIAVDKFLNWYNDEKALQRQDFRHRRVEALLQSRRALATQILAWLPTPYLFPVISLFSPLLSSPPHNGQVHRVRLFPSRSLEAYSWKEVLAWYEEDALTEDDEVMRAGERTGQIIALLKAAMKAEGELRMLEERCMCWEDFRSDLMRVMERELAGAPFSVGQG
ncbi:unnamed protein product, partial [Choristocarpus tenellus]